MTSKRILSPEEKELWKLVTQHDKKLHKEECENTSSAFIPEKKQPKLYVKHRFRPAPLPVAQKHNALGEYAGIDKKTASRFRKGNTPIDATLDLHDMRAAEAHKALIHFIAIQYAQGARCVLIITGKGKTGQGILKRSLPEWLADDNIAPMILAMDMAKAKHGGSGAYYILLRRKR